MSDTEQSDLPSAANLAPGVRPEELPPVEPPSAGYIVQLFLIPALIVAAVIGVWALFGMMAQSESDWEQLVVDIGSSNPNRRWRSALGLAQVLRNQQIKMEKDEVALADQPKVAKALANLLSESLKIKSPEDPDEEIRNRDFLARTLGALRVDDVVLPVLADALDEGRDPEVRKSSLMSLAMIAGRHFEEQAADVELLEPDREYGVDEAVVTLKKPLPEPTISDAAVLQQIEKAARDGEPAVRHLAVFALGVVSGPDAIRQLNAALLDRDPMTRANAAVGLARNGQIEGLPVLTELLDAGTNEMSKDDFTKLDPEEQEAEIRRRQFEQPIILSNCIRAVDSILVRLNDEQRQTLRPIVNKIATENTSAAIRTQAQKLLNRFEI